MANKKTKTKSAAKATKSMKKQAAKSTKSIQVKDKPMTKSEILKTMAEITTKSKKEIGDALEALKEVIQAHLKNGAVGQFNLPGLIKIHVVKKPATKARKGINPFTGQEMMFKAKPARKVVKVKPLKELKEMV
jgi:nucleoid DNA-binding protein